MRSDSFAVQVLENIARTAPPFAAHRPNDARTRTHTRTLHARRPRSFLSWLRQALAAEPLHDDSPGHDEMRSTHDESAPSDGTFASGQGAAASPIEVTTVGEPRRDRNERDAPLTPPGEGRRRDARKTPGPLTELAAPQPESAPQHHYDDFERVLLAVSGVTRRVWIAVAAVSAVAVVGLILVAVLVDLDSADRVASVIGVVVGAISLGVAVYTLSRPAGVAVAGARSVQAGGSIGRAVSGDNNRQQGAPAQPQPPAAGPSPSATTTAATVSGERGVAAGGSIGEAITGDGNQQT